MRYPSGKRVVASMLSTARRRALRKGLDFELDLEYLESIWPINDICPALGILMEVKSGGPTSASPSLDRVIPELGYIKGNVAIVSRLANQVMSHAHPHEVIRVARYFEGAFHKALMNKEIEQRYLMQFLD